MSDAQVWHRGTARSFQVPSTRSSTDRAASHPDIKPKIEVQGSKDPAFPFILLGTRFSPTVLSSPVSFLLLLQRRHRLPPRITITAIVAVIVQQKQRLPASRPEVCILTRFFGLQGGPCSLSVSTA